MTEALATFRPSGADKTRQRPLALRVGRGFSWSLLGAVFNQGSTFFMNFVLANMFGRELFGQYALAVSTLNAFVQLSQLGMGYTATKYIAEFRSEQKVRATRILSLCGAISIGTALLASFVAVLTSSWVSGHWLGRPEIGRAILMGGGFVFFGILNGYLIGVLTGLERFAAIGKLLVGVGLLYTACCATLGHFLGRDGAVFGMTITAGAQFLLLLWLAKRELARSGMTFSRYGMTEERGVVLQFALPGALSGFTAIPALWIGNALISRQQGGEAQAALYTASYNLAMLVLFIPVILNSVVMPTMNSQQGSGDSAGYRRSFWLNLWVSALAVVLSGAVLAVMGRSVLALYGERFAPAYPVLLLLLLATLPEALTIALNQVPQSHARIWRLLFQINLPRDIAIILVGALLIPRWGAVGMGIAYLTGRAIAMALMTMLVWKDAAIGRARGRA